MAISARSVRLIMTILKLLTGVTLWVVAGVAVGSVITATIGAIATTVPALGVVALVGVIAGCLLLGGGAAAAKKL